MPVTAAIAGGLGAAGSIGGALIGSSAAQNAANTQAQLGYAGLAQQQKMFGVAQQTLQPFSAQGAAELPALNNTIGALGPLISGLGPTINSIKNLATNGITNPQNLPGFQFQSQWGTQAAQNALTAQGLGGSVGPLATAISQYNQGLAGTYVPQYYNMALSGLTTQGNLQLQQIQSALGQTGALQNLVGSGVSAGGALAGASINSGNAQASTLQNIGTAQASGILGSANALSGGLSGATGSISNSLLLSQLMGSGGLYGSSNFVNQDNQAA